MIREYMALRNNIVSVIDATNEITSFIERNFESDEELLKYFEDYDKAIDRVRIYH